MSAAGTGRLHKNWKTGKRVAVQQFEAHPWKLIPVWHPAYWFGYRVRRWWWEGYSIGGEYDGEYEYKTHHDHAHLVLAEHCESRVRVCKVCKGDCGQCGGPC